MTRWLLLLTLIWLLVRWGRRLWGLVTGGRGVGGRAAGGDRRRREPLSDLTEQEISDADFEEIP